MNMKSKKVQFEKKRIPYVEVNVYAFFCIRNRTLYYNENYKRNDNLAPIIRFIQ